MAQKKMRSLWTFLLLAVWQATAFVPCSFQRSHNTVNRMFEAGTSSDASSDPLERYESYAPGASKVAIREDLVGTGESAKAGDVVSVKYSGRILSNGKEFDSGTYAFKLGEGKVIPGWEKGIMDMKVGGKRSLRIPPSFAYGDTGSGEGTIPPNSDLEFDCELKSISTGPVAEVMANLGIGLNKKTFLVVLFAMSIILPKLGIGEKGFI